LRILVTGATGFIGRNLIGELIKKGHEVFVLVRKTSNLDFLRSQPVKFVYADLTEEKSLQPLAGYNFEAIFHCAGSVENRNWKKLFTVNVVGTENICRLAQESKVKKFIYTSSVSVVSGNKEVLLTEELPFSATNLYGLSKIEAEKKVLEFRQKGLPTAIFRPCMVYGENEPHLLDSMLWLLKHRLLPIVDEGKAKMHLVYVRNVADAMIQALSDERFMEGAFFLADAEILTTKEIFSIFSQAIKGPATFILPSWLTPLFVNLPFMGKKIKFLLKDRTYDISKIKSLGYPPRFQAQESLKISAQYWLRKRTKPAA
jgi:nucleoside-diphosphate-sugar epimerase